MLASIMLYVIYISTNNVIFTEDLRRRNRDRDESSLNEKYVDSVGFVLQ